MKPQQSTRRLEKFIVYVLGRRPDEFGLVPEAEGWVKLKDLLKAINEENGWRHVRRSHIDEIVLTQPAPEIEINDNRVRARLTGASPGSATGGRTAEVALHLHQTSCLFRGA